MASMTQTEEKFSLSLLRPDGEDKWKHMGLDKHLQISIAIGLIESYSGASCYLNDRLNPMQASKTVVLRVESRNERLDFQSLIKKDVPFIPEDGTTEATHIVMGVTYGAEAYCVLTKDLDSTIDDDKTPREEETKLMILATKLTKALEDKEELTGFLKQFEDEEKETLARMNCRLYADFQTEQLLECNVLDVYERLFYMIQDTDNDKAVPINLQLYPLKDIIGYSVAGKGNVPDYRDIDSHLVPRCCRLFANLQLIGQAAEIDYNKLNKEDQSSLFPYLDAIQKFQGLVKERMKNCIVKARSCEKINEDREIATTIYLVEIQSPFKHSLLTLAVQCNEADVKIKSHNDKITVLTRKFNLKEELSSSSGSKYFLVLFVPAFDGKTHLEDLKYAGKYLEDYFYGNTRSVILKATFWLEICRKIQNKICELINYVSVINKHSTNEIKFFVAPEEDIRGFGYRYCLYETDSSCLPVPRDNLNHFFDPAVVSLISSICDGNNSTPESSPFVNLWKWDYEELELPSSFLSQPRLEGKSWFQDLQEFNPANTARRILDLRRKFLRDEIHEEIQVPAVVQDPFQFKMTVKKMVHELDTFTVDIRNLERFVDEVRERGFNNNFALFAKDERRFVQVNCVDGFLAYNCLNCQKTCKNDIPYSHLDGRKEEDNCDEIFCQCPRYRHEYQSVSWCPIWETVDTNFEDMKAEFKRKLDLRGIDDEKFLVKCCEGLVSMKAKAFNLLDQMERYIRSFDCDEVIQALPRYLNRLQTMANELQENLLANPTINRIAEEEICRNMEM